MKDNKDTGWRFSRAQQRTSGTNLWLRAPASPPSDVSLQQVSLPFREAGWVHVKPASLLLIYTWLFLFGFIPILLVLIASFLSKNTTALVSLPWTLQNYQELLSPALLRIFLRSIWVAGLTTVLCLVFAFPFSYFLIRSKHKATLLLLIIIPFWTSSLIRTYAMIALLKFHGILNTILLKLHLISHPLNLLYNHFAVICGLTYNLFPFMVLPLFTQMERFDFRLLEAASDLGATRWVLFSRVFLPNNLGGIISGCLLVFLPAMTMFYIPNVLGGARSILLGNMIQSQFLVVENWPLGSATSSILTGSLLLVLFLFRRVKREVV